MGIARFDHTRGVLVPPGAARPDTRRRHLEPGRRFRNTARWKRFSAAIIARDEVCQVCGEGPRPRDPLTAGHIVPVSRGGAIFDEDNARAEHRTCNSRRGTKAAF